MRDGNVAATRSNAATNDSSKSAAAIPFAVGSLAEVENIKPVRLWLSRAFASHAYSRMTWIAILGMVRGRRNSHDFRYSHQQLVALCTSRRGSEVDKAGDVGHPL